MHVTRCPSCAGTSAVAVATRKLLAEASGALTTISWMASMCGSFQAPTILAPLSSRFSCQPSTSDCTWTTSPEKSSYSCLHPLQLTLVHPSCGLTTASGSFGQIGHRTMFPNGTSSPFGTPLLRTSFSTPMASFTRRARHIPFITCSTVESVHPGHCRTPFLHLACGRMLETVRMHAYMDSTSSWFPRCSAVSMISAHSSSSSTGFSPSGSSSMASQCDWSFANASSASLQVTTLRTKAASDTPGRADALHARHLRFACHLSHRSNQHQPPRFAFEPVQARFHVL
mmetsp:Transcript_11443/g.70291  ORF Transcript_11443/g.70291 Transcript_11443/m.70291 type:complete len:285 (-) Transcript_11443:69-923(-)